MDAECAGAVPAGAWRAIPNTEQLGPVMIFAVSNYGAQGAGSVRAPEALAECFGVGNAMTAAGAVRIHAASGRGPSLCDPAVIKPDLVAPGTGVRTTIPGGYATVTGTGAAAAYAAASAALLREANPNLSAAEIKGIFTASATALGSEGSNNLSGAGLLTIPAAFAMAQSAGNTGTVIGTVRYGGEPVTGAHVVLTSRGGNLDATTQNGVFQIDHVSADRKYILSAGRLGYSFYERPDSLEVHAGTTTNIFINLERGFHDNAEFDQGWNMGVD
jgi:subtilisin family serine protease